MASQLEQQSFSHSFHAPFYEVANLNRLVIILGLGTQAISLFFFSAGLVRVSVFPATSFYYMSQLPFTFWWGIATAIALLFSASLLPSRPRMLVEIASLLLLGLYTIGFPSFVYEGPRILDSYAHMSNVLLIVNGHGWIDSSGWYVRQFPGAYTFFAQLVTVAGIDPFNLMKYYVVGCSSAIVLFLYVIARSYNASYAGMVSAFLVGGLWFQLHLCPQSFELIPYLGIMVVFLRILFDVPRRRIWTALAILSVPALIVSHPETPAIIMLGTAGLLILPMFLPGLRTRVKGIFAYFTVFLLSLAGFFLIWWSTVASEARVLIQSVAERSISYVLLGKTTPQQTVPIAPQYSYQLAVFLEQGVSVTVWVLGAVLLLLSRSRVRVRDYPFWAFFLAAVSTVPITFYVRADMLQRSYLFSLLPMVVLFASLMGQKVGFRGRSLVPIFKYILIFSSILFLVLMPITRNGVDPYEYVPRSSLYVSNISADLTQDSHSILFLYNGEYAWRYYASLFGATTVLREEQANLYVLSGGFVKDNSTVTVAGQIFNLPFTSADRTSHYIVLSDFYENLYILRFGQGSAYYISQKSLFERQVGFHFNLVYSTGTDRVYTNPSL